MTAVAAPPKPSIACHACRHIIAVRLTDGRFESRHKGRTIRGHALEIVCDDCGRPNFLLDTPSPDVLE
jgi:hypothetical protein